MGHAEQDSGYSGWNPNLDTQGAPEHTVHGRTNTRCGHPRDPALGKVREQVDAVAEKGKEKEQAVNAVPTGAILTSGGRGGTDSDVAEDGEERVCSEVCEGTP